MVGKAIEKENLRSFGSRTRDEPGAIETAVDLGRCFRRWSFRMERDVVVPLSRNLTRFNIGYEG